MGIVLISHSHFLYSNVLNMTLEYQFSLIHLIAKWLVRAYFQATWRRSFHACFIFCLAYFIMQVLAESFSMRVLQCLLHQLLSLLHIQLLSSTSRILCQEIVTVVGSPSWKAEKLQEVSERNSVSSISPKSIG